MQIDELIYLIPAILIALTMHEFGHAFVAYKLGDITQKERGRLTLNPVRHIDLIGLLCLLMFQFGWAKPVQVEPYYFKNHKDGMIWTAVSGPIMNFIIGFISVLFMMFMIKIIGLTSITYHIMMFFQYCALVNVGLGIFNLIPIPPLDGSKVLMGLLPENLYFKILHYENLIGLLLLVCLYIGVLDQPLIHARSVILEGFMNIANFIVR